LADIDEYLKGILEQMLVSYKILTELNDNPNDLKTIKKELSKICGLLQVIRRKLDEKKYQSDHLVALHKLSTYYINTYDFTREIKILAQVYYKDSNRLKNLRLMIINSLNDKKLVEKLQSILIKL
jgi:DNA repair ATPase RecN